MGFCGAQGVILSKNSAAGAGVLKVAIPRQKPAQDRSTEFARIGRTRFLSNEFFPLRLRLLKERWIE
jgi:hypothetical protein